ncbi:MAG: hypothetical protein Q4C64_07100 [Erysipelotrichia bacterium]|nr:hypothetical protein [Erysipelotrichia bacterium]
MIISPSIASSDVLHVADEVDFAGKYFDDIHIDIEDGIAVSGITFGMKMASAICKRAAKTTSLHLEVLRPLDYLDELAKIRPDIIFIQVDHLDNPEEVIDKFRKASLNVSVALTDRDINKNYDRMLSSFDQILMLTAEHDDPKQEYQEYLKNYGMYLAEKFNLKLWLDGGINHHIYHNLKDTNVYAAVMGRAIFSDKAEAIKLYSKQVKL